MMRRRRPLMRGAMVAGMGYTAYKAGQAGQRNQYHEQEQEQRIQELEQQQYTAPPQQYAPPPPPAPAPAAQVDVVGELTKLKGLLDAGVLTQEEFDQQKARVLSAS